MPWILESPPLKSEPLAVQLCTQPLDEPYWALQDLSSVVSKDFYVLIRDYIFTGYFAVGSGIQTADGRFKCLQCEFDVVFVVCGGDVEFMMVFENAVIQEQSSEFSQLLLIRVQT